MNVAYVQPIFGPNLELLERNIKSIESFFAYYKKHGYTFRCIFGGYCATDELWNIIYNKINECSLEAGTTPIIKRFDKNYGKAYIVNHLVEEYIEYEEYFLTADSDIQYPENEKDIINRLIESFKYATEINLNPSLIALNQEENNCHLLEYCYQNKKTYRSAYDEEMICYPDGGGGVAGGCLFISTAFWKKVKGYKVLGVYAGDDANLMQDSYLNGYKFLMADTIHCIHPYENDGEYIQWKVKTCPQTKNLNDAIRDADRFWNKETTEQLGIIDGAKFSYVICHGNTSEYRRKNIESLIKYLRNTFKDDIEIIVSEQGPTKSHITGINQHAYFEDSGVFQRSKVLNNGVKLATYENIFIGDNDVILHEDAMRECLKLIEQYDTVNPYDKIIDLSEYDSSIFMLYLNLYFENNWSIRTSTVFSGGCFLIKKSIFINVGGFDEEIIGWGGEDNAFTFKVEALISHITNQSTVYHLFHDRGFNGNPFHNHYQNNLKVLDRLHNMNHEELVEYCENGRKNFQ